MFRISRAFAALAVFSVLFIAACSVPVSEKTLWGEVTVDGETYEISKQTFRQDDGESSIFYDSYTVRVDGKWVSCNVRAVPIPLPFPFGSGPAPSGPPPTATEIRDDCAVAIERALAASSRGGGSSYSPPT